MIVKLTVGDRLVAQIIEATDIALGAHTISNELDPLQLLMMKRPVGYVVKKHTHAKKERKTTTRQKALVVLKGVLEVVVCDETGREGNPVLLRGGQCLLLIEGGYEIRIKEEATFFEFKNGPHTEDKILL